MRDRKDKNRLPKISLVLGAVALILVWVPLVSPLLGIAGLVVSAIAFSRSKALEVGRKQARNGIILNIAALVIFAAVASLLVGIGG